MTKGILIVMLLTSLSTGLLAQAPPWLWVASVKEQEGNMGGDVAIDAHGNIYMTGDFTATLTLENETLVSRGGKDVFIAKYNSLGKLVWAKSAGGIYDDKPPGIAFDNAGYVYIAGSFAEQAHFDNQQVTSQGQHDVFLAKYDPDGNLVWVKSFGGPGMEIVSLNNGRGLFIDAYSRIYLTGSFHETVDFGGVSVTSKGGRDIYLTKLDSSGTVLWAKSAGSRSSSSDAGADVCVDATGNIYLTGAYDGTASFDTFKLSSVNFADMFLTKYDSSGNVLWARTAGGSLPDNGSALVCDENMNVYVLGVFNSSQMFFGSTVVSNRGFYDVFLAKYNAAGDLVWVKSAGWTGGEGLGNIAYRDGGIYIAGFFDQGMIFDSNTLWSHEGNGGEDGFVAKYNVNGVFQWARNAGGLGSDRLFGIAVDPNGFPVVTGRVNSATAPFGNVNVEGPNARFIAKLGLFPEHVAERVVQGIRIYPNPTTGILHVSPDNGIAIGKACIRDMQGRLVREYPHLGSGSLDVSDLPQGMYLLYLDTDKGRVLHRFLKETAD